MTCPKCDIEQLCPCDACKEKNEGFVVWKDLPNDMIACGGCGFTKHADWWLDRSFEFYERIKNEPGNK